MFSFGRRMFVSSALAFCAFAAMATDAHAQSSSLVGQRLGRNGSGQEVKVTREVGSGFASRWQASAAARMTGSEAVLVKTRDGKFHACATSANALDGFKPADYSGIAELIPLVSPASVAGGRAGRSDTAYFASVFGVDEAQIRTQRSETARDPGVINVVAKLPYPGMHGPENQLDQGFKLGARSGIQIDRGYIEKKDARFAASVLFHEASHLEDYELAQRWAEKYSRETSRSTLADRSSFMTWLMDGKRGLPKDDARTVADTVLGAHGSTEARAYIGTFIVALQAGAGDVAKTQLVTYAKTDAFQQPPPAIVQDALEKDHDRAYGTLDAQGKKDFDASIAAAKSANPKAWISNYKRGSGRRS